MKIAVLIIRVLLGLLFAFASITFLFKLVPQPELSGAQKVFMDGMNASVYMMTTVKLIELICAIAFITGFFVPLATVVIFPISLNILLFHVFVTTEGLPVAIFVIAANLVLAWTYRDKYKHFLTAK